MWSLMASIFTKIAKIIDTTLVSLEFMPTITGVRIVFITVYVDE